MKRSTDRKSPDRKDMQSSVAGSSTTRKKKRSSGLDEESKAKMASMEVKIEDLRKQSFGEINRLEAVIERYKADQTHQLGSVSEQLKSNHRKASGDIDDLRKQTTHAAS